MLLLLPVFTLLFAGPPASAGKEYRTGASLLEQQRGEAAAIHLLRAVRLDPTLVPAWKALGVVYASAKNYEAAEPAFGEACRRGPREPDACYFWGRSLYALDRFTASIAALEKALPADRDPARIHEAIGQAREALGDSDAAERHFRYALQSGGGRHALAYARFLIRQGRAKEAVPLLRNAIVAGVPSSELQMELGRALLQLDQVKAAAAELRKAVQLDAANAQAAILLQKALSRLSADPPARP